MTALGIRASEGSPVSGVTRMRQENVLRLGAYSESWRSVDRAGTYALAQAHLG